MAGLGLVAGGGGSFVGEGEVGAPETYVEASGIATAEAFGTAKLNLRLAISAIVSAEALGTANVANQQFVSGAGAIATAEVVPSPGVPGITIGEIVDISAASGASISVTLPASRRRGDGLIFIASLGRDTGGIPSNFSGWPSWADSTGNSDQSRTNLRQVSRFVAQLDGTETDFTLTKTSTDAHHVRIIVVRGGFGRAAVTQSGGNTVNPVNIGGSGATGSNAAPDAGSNGGPGNAWDSGEPTVWLTYMAKNVGATNAVSGYPTNYGDNQAAVDVTGDKLGFAMATRTLGATSENAGAFTIGATAAWCAGTLAIRPTEGHSAFFAPRVSAIASAEAHGTTKVNERLAPSGLASAEAFGTAKLNLRVLAAAIASAETFGTSKLNLQLLAAAIASAEAFGTAKLNLQLLAAAIASAEAFGTPALNLRVAAAAVASAESFGTAQLNLRVLAATIASAEAFGTPTADVIQTLLPSGVASAGDFGTAKLNLRLLAAAIASAETLGTAKLNLRLLAAAIASAESLGASKVNLRVLASAIASAEAFGALEVINSGGVQQITPSGVSTAEAVGTPAAYLRLLQIGIASAEAFGTPTADVIQTLLPSGVASAGDFGTTKLNLRLLAAAIASAEAFGTPTADVIQTLLPSEVASAAAFGTTKLNLRLLAAAIASVEAFGDEKVIRRLLAEAIASAEGLGDPTLVPGIGPSAIESLEAFGLMELLREATTGSRSEVLGGGPADRLPRNDLRSKGFPRNPHRSKRLKH